MKSQQEKLLDRYALGRVLGVGGMGTVVEAHDDVLDRRVAIKFLKPEYANDEAVVERFRREARIAASLSHPGIAQVFDFQEEDGRKFIVMELLQGRDLHTHLVQNGPMQPNEASRVIADAASALGHAHIQGAVHRDVKPGNIFITKTGTVKVTDFGIAVAKSQHAVTATGEVLGTALYLSPEQIEGAKATPASDVYALGCVLFQTLTGRPPYEGENQMAIARSHTSAPVPSAGAIDSSIPPEMEGVVQKAMAKDPGERYPSAGEMAIALREFATNLDTEPAGFASPPTTEFISGAPPTKVQRDTSAHEAVPPARRRFRLVRQVIAVVLLVLALVTVVLMARSPGPPAPTPLPNLTGKLVDEATEESKRLGIPSSHITTRETEDLTEEEAGIVVRQSPSPGTKIMENTRLVLTVSKGRGVQVPNVAGLDREDAERLLREKGFAVVVQTEPAPDDQKGRVVAFEPGGLQPPGTPITITIGEEMEEEKGRGRKGGGDGD